MRACVVVGLDLWKAVQESGKWQRKLRKRRRLNRRSKKPPTDIRAFGRHRKNARRERHWTARWAQAAWDYFKEDHRWIIGLLFCAVVAIIVKAKGERTVGKR